MGCLLALAVGVEFFGVSRPARVVGGDFYDFLDVDSRPDGRLALVLTSPVVLAVHHRAVDRLRQ
mgnify:CR=1 FL=1